MSLNALLTAPEFEQCALQLIESQWPLGWSLPSPDSGTVIYAKELVIAEFLLCGSASFRDSNMRVFWPRC